MVLFATNSCPGGNRTRFSFRAGRGEVRVGLQAAGADLVPVDSIVHARRLLVLFALAGIVCRSGATPTASLEDRTRRSSLGLVGLWPLLGLGKGLCLSTRSAKAHAGRVRGAVVASLSIASGLFVAVVVGVVVVGGDAGAAALVLRSDLGQEALALVHKVEVDRHWAQIWVDQFLGR